MLQNVAYPTRWTGSYSQMGTPILPLPFSPQDAVLSIFRNRDAVTELLERTSYQMPTGHRDLESLAEQAGLGGIADFKALLVADFGVNWPVRLIEWWNLDFAEFMSKTGLRATLAKKAELMTLWEGVRNDCLAHTDSLRKLDRKIDLKVYNIYGLLRRHKSIVDQYYEAREI